MIEFVGVVRQTDSRETERVRAEPCSCANRLASRNVTWRSMSRSHLLPTSMMTMLGLASVRASDNHFDNALNVSRLHKHSTSPDNNYKHSTSPDNNYKHSISPDNNYKHSTSPDNNYNTRLTALCPGISGRAGTRKVKPIWILLKQPDNHASTPPVSFFQTGCPSCCPTNSVKALKA